jgi:integrase
MSTNVYATADDLTKSLKIKNRDIISASNVIINDCIAICNDAGYSIVGMDIDRLVEMLKARLKGEDKFRLDFIKFAGDEIAGMPKSTGALYIAAVNAFVRYLKKTSLDILDIDTEMLRRFEDFIIEEPSRWGLNRKGQRQNIVKKGRRAVSAYLSCIRALYNRARKKYNKYDRGIIKIPFYPFEHYGLKSSPAPRKRALSIDVIQRIIELPYEKEIVGGRWNLFNLAKDCFLLSFGLAGMNSADLFTCKPDKNGIITYNREKTKSRRDDRAEMKIRIEDCISNLIDKYRDPEDKNLFRFYSHYADSQHFNAAINTGLKKTGGKLGIDDLEYYAARHSWATIARSAAVGIDKATVHEALNHVDDQMKITDIYIDRDWSVIWEANRKVLGLFDWSAVAHTSC